jgi:hypothetical protein
MIHILEDTLHTCSIIVKIGKKNLSEMSGGVVNPLKRFCYLYCFQSLVFMLHARWLLPTFSSFLVSLQVLETLKITFSTLLIKFPQHMCFVSLSYDMIIDIHSSLFSISSGNDEQNFLSHDADDDLKMHA